MALILVADDDRVTRAMLSNILQARGHRVVEAPDGVQALELNKKNDFDLAFIDIFMPEKDGVQTAKSLVADTPTIKIVAMSGGSTFTATESLKWAKRYCKHILPKPFDEAQIIAILLDLLK